MNPSARAFCERLAQLLLAQSWDSVYDMLAPWMRAASRPADVREFFETDYRDALLDAGIEGTHLPAQHYVSGNDSSLPELREPVTSGAPAPPIPVEVTTENFRQWARVQLQCSEEQADTLGFDYFSEVWLIACEIDGTLCVGYWTHDPYSFRPWNAPHPAPSQ